MTNETLKQWDSDVVIKNMKVESLTNNDIEAQVHEIFKVDKTSSADTEKIVDLIPYINWSKYAKGYSEEFFNIMMWFGSLKIRDKDMLTNILDATNGLDGAYTDAYCSALKNLFFNNKDIFVNALNDIDDEQLKNISSYVHYGCNPEEAKEISEYFKDIIEPKANLFIESFK